MNPCTVTPTTTTCTFTFPSEASFGLLAIEIILLAWLVFVLSRKVYRIVKEDG